MRGSVVAPLLSLVAVTPALYDHSWKLEDAKSFRVAACLPLNVDSDQLGRNFFMGDQKIGSTIVDWMHPPRLTETFNPRRVY
jgi:hypothetical protein